MSGSSLKAALFLNQRLEARLDGVVDAIKNGFVKKGYESKLVRSTSDCVDCDIIIYECPQDWDIPDFKLSGKVFVYTTTIRTEKGLHKPLDYVNPHILEHASQLKGILTAGCNEAALSIYRNAGLAVVNMPGNIPLDESQYYDKGAERNLSSVFIGNAYHKSEQFKKFIVPFSHEVECLFITPPGNEEVVNMAEGQKRFLSSNAASVNDLFNKSKLVPVIHWPRQPELNPRLITAVGSGALPISDNRDLVKHFYDGLLPSSEDPSEWISIAKKYLADEEERRSLVKRLRGICVKRYSNVALVEKLEAA